MDLVLSEYLKIPTENPPGKEMPALLYLARILRERGHIATIHETAPERGVLECSIGPSEGGSIVLLHHVDVVPATEEGWEIPPYSGEIRDGFVWGRGALDMKGQGIMELGAFLALAERAGSLRKRVTYLAVSDEEQGGLYGAKWAADNLMDSLRPDLVINEGGGGVRDVFGAGIVFAVEVTQKAAMKVRLIATGAPGHGSSPPRDYATKSLAKALAKVAGYSFPVMFTPVVVQMLKQMASRMTGIRRFALERATGPIFQRFLEQEISKDQRLDSMIRTSLSITMLKSGEAPNVIPGRAEAVLDIRVLPGHDPADAVRVIRNLVEEYGVEVESHSEPLAPRVSPFDSDHFRLLERLLKDEAPDSVVLPIMASGATDSRFFREKGVPCYGIMPAILSAEDTASVHGYNEKISIDNLMLGERVFRHLLENLCL